ncbi:unnamed protein product [Plutella xylostella]|uniref:(diamondback moth) hypothetical protein n=1 Tax=Plutella xylostella TaxID=51655 RepID=A0A8S4GDH7_PLUXY|nr:unnamed protein product [Plutella xylostella]
MKSKPTHYADAPFRPWPPLARPPHNFYFRPSEPMDLRGFKTSLSTYSDFSAASAYSGGGNKARDYYFSSAAYRRAELGGGSHAELYAGRERRARPAPPSACSCSRSRSLEDVRTDVVTEWEDDEPRAPAFSRAAYRAAHHQPFHSHHSMENLVDKSPQIPPPKRVSHLQGQSRNGSHPSVLTAGPVTSDVNGSRPTFKPVTVLEDLQAVRCAEFHPNGKLYAVGSNTKTLRICTYPKIENVKANSESTAPTVLLKRTKHHKGSIYCLAWSPAGDLLATGSNDKTVKLMRFNSHACNLEGQEVELAMHDGTVRDVCFIEDTSNKASLLVSGGAGDCKIYVTDCATGNTFQALSGHSGHVLSLYNWGGAMFVSGGQDKTVRFWDLRTGGCVNTISPGNLPSNKGSAVASLAVDPSGRLLVCGHDDGSCALHDVRGSRALQRFTPHSGDVRSVRFSPGAYYLLTAGMMDASCLLICKVT